MAIQTIDTNSAAIRYALLTNNMYVPNTNEYNSTNNMVSGNFASSIGTLMNGIPPFKSLLGSAQNSLLGRLLPVNQTPLTIIGTEMLAKQMFYNASTHIIERNMPTINVLGAIKGNGKLFTKKVNYQITVKTADTFMEKVGNFMDKVTFNTSLSDYPFKPSSTNDDFIENTGTGQLNYLYSAVNKNLYKPNGTVFNKYGNIASNPVEPKMVIVDNTTYFDFDDRKRHPYLSIYPNSAAVSEANAAMQKSYNSLPNDIDSREYAPTADYVYSNFGTTNKTTKVTNPIEWIPIDSNVPTNNDELKNKLVWGRDGVDVRAYLNLAPLHGDTDTEKKNLEDTQYPIDFKIRGGLLEYTRNLLNAAEGSVVDVTRKVFVNGNEVVGFNGAPSWKANNLKYATDSGTAEKLGVRQHTMLDPYDNFGKAIRYKGNISYGGNPNSVIYKSVIPRIHPTINEDKTINNKNLMFSIENLAVGVIAGDKYGIIDDEFGSQIPMCEVGPFNGRMMWFPPYDIQINETSNAKFESTVMVGRSEPMYNYMNSERSANLSFTLLADYPEQLKNYQGVNKEKEITDFFAFGGNPYVSNELMIEGLKAEQERLRAQLTTITGPVKVANPNLTMPPNTLWLYFDNDLPKEGTEGTVVDDMYYSAYEIQGGYVLPTGEKYGFGLNQMILYTTGLTRVDTGGVTLLPENIDYLKSIGFTQYNVIRSQNQFGLDNNLTKALKNVYDNTDNTQYYDIEIVGHTSLLFNGADEKAYNDALGQRRADAAKAFVDGRLTALYGSNSTDLGIKVTTKTKGSAGAGKTGAKAENMWKREVKEERYATITIKRNSTQPPDKVQDTNTKDKRDNASIQADIDAIEAVLNNLGGDGCILNERQAAILKGFQSVSGNNYYPTFHSQTPEDFHKRLTFLQQCTRQGSSKKKGDLSAKNSVFGRQPICILRIGDFFYTKIIIESVNIDYNDTTWDMNPEGMGMQPMYAKVSLQLKILGGQSLKGPIDALQNAASFNYYANSSFKDNGMYKLPSTVANAQDSYIQGVTTEKRIDMVGNLLSSGRYTITNSRITEV